MNKYWFLLLNNLVVIVIHIVITLFTLFLIKLLVDNLSYDGVLRFFLSKILSLLAIGLYFLFGLFLTGRILGKQSSALMNFLSVSILIPIGIVILAYLFYEEAHASSAYLPTEGVGGTLYSLFLFPFSSTWFEMFNIDFKNTAEKILLLPIPVLPTVLIWLGMQLHK